MNIDALKSANVPVPTPNTSSDTTLSEDNKTAYELAREAYKVKADLASIALAQSEITYYEDLLKKDDKTLMDMLKSGTPDAKELAVISQRVFETGARIEAMKANVAEAEAEVGRKGSSGGGVATQKASDVSAPSESAKTPAGDTEFQVSLERILSEIPQVPVPADMTVFEFYKSIYIVEPSQSRVDAAKAVNVSNKEKLLEAEAHLNELAERGGGSSPGFGKLSNWVFELGSRIKALEATIGDAEAKILKSQTASSAAQQAAAEKTSQAVAAASVRPVEDTEDIKFLRQHIKSLQKDAKAAYDELQARNQEYSTAQDRSGNIQSPAVQAADHASNRAAYKYKQVMGTLANFEAELARAISSNVSA